jgi:hypothetical protein
VHAQAHATPEYAQFVDAVRREILEYFGVADNQLDWVVLLRNDDSDELWAEVNRRRSVASKSTTLLRWRSRRKCEVSW